MKRYDENKIPLLDALKECLYKNALVSSYNKKIIHCYNGFFYYEDGRIIGNTIGVAYKRLSKDVWSKNSMWHIIGYLTDKELERLRELHASSKYNDPRYFKEQFMKLVYEKYAAVEVS